MSLLTVCQLHRLLLRSRRVLFTPSCYGRYLAPGSLLRPHHERFDENCDPIPFPHPETPRFKNAFEPTPKGRIADKRPFHMICEPHQIYWWCSCGHSRKQPFCDGSHTRIVGHTPYFYINRVQYRPIRLSFPKYALNRLTVLALSVLYFVCALGFITITSLWPPREYPLARKTDVWLCTCKQTGEPPYCDGSHKCPEVQDAIKF